MNIQSVAIASGTEADPAEAMVKAAASAEETEDGDSAVKTGSTEDSAAVTEIVSPPQTEQREKRKSERNGKSRASATASPKGNDLNEMIKLVDLPQKPQLCFCGKSCIVRKE